MAVLLVAEANPRHIALVTGLALFSAVAGRRHRHRSQSYQSARLTTFVDQQPGQQRPDDRGAHPARSQQSQAAIATGGLTGKGFCKGPLTKGGYVPEQHTDFIFTAVGEQFGLARLRPACWRSTRFLLVRIWRIAQIWRATMLGHATSAAGVAARCSLWHVFENVGHDHGDHAGHRHPAAVRVLRRLVDDRLLRHDRPGPERPHAPVLRGPPGPTACLGGRRGAPVAWPGHDSLWPRLEPLLAKVQKPARYIGCEDGADVPTHGPGKVAWLLVYPDTYEIGLPNQGLQILYEILNERADAVAERSYAPWTDLEARAARATGCRCSRSTPTARRPTSTSSPSTCRPSSSTRTS